MFFFISGIRPAGLYVLFYFCYLASQILCPLFPASCRTDRLSCLYLVPCRLNCLSFIFTGSVSCRQRLHVIRYPADKDCLSFLYLVSERKGTGFELRTLLQNCAMPSPWVFARPSPQQCQHLFYCWSVFSTGILKKPENMDLDLVLNVGSRFLGPDLDCDPIFQ